MKSAWEKTLNKLSDEAFSFFNEKEEILSGMINNTLKVADHFSESGFDEKEEEKLSELIFKVRETVKRILDEHLAIKRDYMNHLGSNGDKIKIMSQIEKEYCEALIRRSKEGFEKKSEDLYSLIDQINKILHDVEEILKSENEMDVEEEKKEAERLESESKIRAELDKMKQVLNKTLEMFDDLNRSMEQLSLEMSDIKLVMKDIYSTHVDHDQLNDKLSVVESNIKLLESNLPKVRKFY
jgi:hypothetical protein